MIPFIWIPVNEVVVPDDSEININSSKSVVEACNEENFPEASFIGFCKIKDGDEEQKTNEPNCSHDWPVHPLEPVYIEPFGLVADAGESPQSCWPKIDEHVEDPECLPSCPIDMVVSSYPPFFSVNPSVEHNHWNEGIDDRYCTMNTDRFDSEFISISWLVWHTSAPAIWFFAIWAVFLFLEHHMLSSK